MIDQPLPPPPPPISRGRRYQAYIKPFVIGFLVLASLIPLQGIRGLVLERQQISHDVAQEIAASWGGEQRVAGPVLVLPVSPRRDVGHGTYDGIAPERKPAPGRANKFIVVLPETLMVNGTMLPQTRQRGIYETQLYTQSMTLSGKFARPDLAALGVAAENVNWDDARILLYVSDIGGIIDAPTLDWNGDTSELRATGEKKKVAGTTVPLAGIDDASWPTAYSLRVRPETLCRITEFSEHESNGRELDEGERVAVEVLPVLGQSAAAVEPGDGAFDHPTPGLDDEALHPIGSLDDLGLEIGQDAGQGAVKDRALIGAVGEQFPEKGKQTEQGRQQRETAGAILNVGGGDDAVQQQALRIDQNMPLLALDQLAGIEAVAVDASPPFSALFTL